MNVKKTLASLMLGLIAFAASAQYPDRVVKVINPFAVGGSGDIMQRLFASKLTERTGKTFIVENKTGAAGRIGYEAVAKSPADGHTLVATDAGYTVLPGLYGKLPWDPANDLVPVTIYARTPFVLVVPPNSPFKTLADLLKYAKANPGKVNFGSAGGGSINHLVMEMVSREANVQMTHIPYKSMGESLAGMLSGSLDVMATGVPTVLGQIKAGKVIPLALTADKRWFAAPGIPTLTEQGINFSTYSWFGLMAPKDTPKPVIDYLHSNILKMLDDPAMKPTLDQQGVETSGMPPAEMAKVIREDTRRWTEIIRVAKITAD
ncbi:MAG: tripartite tricarboxylate transporter substrate binding protein [Pseudomonadota bacterium]